MSQSSSGSKTRDFIAYAREVSKQILEWSESSDLSLVAHWDADGIAAGSSLAFALIQRGILFKLRFVDSINEQLLEQLSKENLPVIFLDLGSGYLEEIVSYLKGKVAILDHHQPSSDKNEVVHLNPMNFGFDGSKDISGAGVSYFVSKHIVRDADSSCILAIVGALADLQDKNERRELRGLNSIIVNDAEERGLIKVEDDFVFFGRETRPISKAIASTPYIQIPGLTGNETAVINLLRSLSIVFEENGRLRTLAELSVDEKHKLLAGILQVMIDAGLTLPEEFPLIGKVYTLVKEDKWSPTRDAREFSFLLNSLGRMGAFEVALKLSLGFRGEILEKALEISKEYTNSIQSAISQILSLPGAIQETKNLIVIRGEGIVNPNIVSPISTMIAGGPLYKEDKILVVVSNQNQEELRISVRISSKLVEKGVNAGKIIESVSKKLGGVGGGHNVAAGATIPRKKLIKFLEEVESLLDEKSRN
ncbi:MAG: DHH family phosphoesterase [Thermoproteota archaeon]|nr:DHH family phosphoesterase [Candidatus Brockarchaeota archaeon]MBO3767848.1 DHH family phosphoesterase [Candidatus Brockarchaeota archaeon]